MTWRVSRFAVQVEESIARPRPIRTHEGSLRSVVAVYFAYHAVPTNAQVIGAYRHHALDLWRRSLKRRSQKDRMTWVRMDRLATEWLPPPHVLHPWPEERMAVRYPR